MKIEINSKKLGTELLNIKNIIQSFEIFHAANMASLIVQLLYTTSNIIDFIELFIFFVYKK